MPYQIDIVLIKLPFEHLLIKTPADPDQLLISETKRIYCIHKLYLGNLKSIRQRLQFTNRPRHKTYNFAGFVFGYNRNLHNLGEVFS